MTEFEKIVDEFTNSDLKELFKKEFPFIEDATGKIKGNMWKKQGMKDVLSDTSKTMLKENATFHNKLMEKVFSPEATERPEIVTVEFFVRLQLENNIREKSFYQAMVLMLGYMLESLLNKRHDEGEEWKQKPFCDQELFDLFKNRLNN